MLKGWWISGNAYRASYSNPERTLEIAGAQLPEFGASALSGARSAFPRNNFDMV